MTISGKPPVKETLRLLPAVWELSNKNGSLQTKPNSGLWVDEQTKDEERLSKPTPLAKPSDATPTEGLAAEADILGTWVDTCKKSSSGGGRGLEDLWDCLTICCRYCSKATLLVSRTLGVEFRIFLGGNSQQLESSRYLLRSCKINVADKIRNSRLQIWLICHSHFTSLCKDKKAE